MNENLPLISIALSTYNGEKYLEEQLDSLLRQTYTPLEIIIVDDCSTDSTFHLLKKYEQKHNIFKVFFNEQNLGFNKSFEKVFSLCSGEYIAISDQDDCWMENKVERLSQHIGENLLIYSNSVLIDERGHSLGRNKFKKVQPARNDPRSFSIRNVVAGHTVLFRKELLKLASPFPTVCFYDWWMALVAANENKITNLNEVLTKHRIHTFNASQGCFFSKNDGYDCMHGWINSVLSLENLRYRNFFEELYNIFGKKDDKLLKCFQIKNNKVIYNKKGYFSRLNNARKIVLSPIPGVF